MSTASRSIPKDFKRLSIDIAGPEGNSETVSIVEVRHAALPYESTDLPTTASPSNLDDGISVATPPPASPSGPNSSLDLLRDRADAVLRDVTLEGTLDSSANLLLGSGSDSFLTNPETHDDEMSLLWTANPNFDLICRDGASSPWHATPDAAPPSTVYMSPLSPSFFIDWKYHNARNLPLFKFRDSLEEIGRHHQGRT